MNWVQLGGSIVAVLVLAAIAWALGLGGEEPFADPAHAAAFAEQGLPGFVAGHAVLSADSLRAVVRGRDGSVALIGPHGAHRVVRRVAQPLARRIGQFVEIDDADGQLARFAMRLPDHAAATALVRTLAPAAGAGAASASGLAPQLTSV